MPFHSMTNQLLWSGGLLLQLALLMLLAARGTARAFPCFTVLIAFYTARSVLSQALPGHVPAARLGLLLESFSILDFLLRFAVAGELTMKLTQARRVTAVTRMCALVSAAGVGAAALGMIVHAPAGLPFDRAEAFFSVLFLLLFCWALRRRSSGPVLGITAGFAVFAAADLIASAARVHAFLRHDAHGYLGWSYVGPCAYLCALVVWLAGSRSEDAARAAALSPSTA